MTSCQPQASPHCPSASLAAYDIALGALDPTHCHSSSASPEMLVGLDPDPLLTLRKYS